MSRDDFNPNSTDAVLARLESKLDAALEEQRRHREEIDKLKTWRAYVVGICTAIAAIVSYLVGGRQ